MTGAEMADMKEALSAMGTPLSDVHAVFDKWLYLDRAADDFDFIDVTLACALDRDVAGDPVWLFLIAPSGAMKTETIRSLDNWSRTYTLDSMSPRALVSGKRIGTNDEGLPIMGGVLHALDDKILVVKDFTIVLSMPDHDRYEVLAVLRNAYDGKLEKAFGTMSEKISQKASFGFIAAVTPVVDIHQKVQTVLGERYLKVRMHPDRRKTTKRARENVGKQLQMRAELAQIVGEFLNGLSFDTVPTFTTEQEDVVEDLAYYISLMRSWVFSKSYHGETYEIDAPEPEVPTRAVQQLTKLGQMLAIVRGHEVITVEDMNTLRRIARDSSIPKRQEILEACVSLETDEVTYADLRRESRMHYNSIRIECEKMVALDIFRSRVEREDYEDEDKNPKVYLRLSEDFKPLSDAVNNKEETKK